MMTEEVRNSVDSMEAGDQYVDGCEPIEQLQAGEEAGDDQHVVECTPPIRKRKRTMVASTQLSQPKVARKRQHLAGKV